MTTHTPGPTKPVMAKCECRIDTDALGFCIRYCPTHAAAPALLALVTRVQAWLDAHPHHDRLTVNDFVDGTGITAESCALLRAVEG